MKRLYRGIIICFFILYCASASAAERRFSLVVSGGFGTTRVGDLNSTRSSIGSVVDELKADYPGLVSGEIRPVPTRYKNWEAEFRWAFWRSFSMGISLAGPTRYYGNSSYTISNSFGTESVTVSYESEIKVSAPIKLNLHYSLPVISKVNLTLSGGIGRYRARMTQIQGWQNLFEDDSSYLGFMSFDVRGSTIGYHCGLALEYKINDRLILLAESQWQFAKIRSLDGSNFLAGYEYDALGNLVWTSSESWDGSLYHYTGEDEVLGPRTEKLMVPEFYPWDGIDFPADERKATLDLGGFTFKIGLKIGLF